MWILNLKSENRKAFELLQLDRAAYACRCDNMHWGTGLVNNLWWVRPWSRRWWNWVRGCRIDAYWSIAVKCMHFTKLVGIIQWLQDCAWVKSVARISAVPNRGKHRLSVWSVEASRSVKESKIPNSSYRFCVGHNKVATTNIPRYIAREPSSVRLEPPGQLILPNCTPNTAPQASPIPSVITPIKGIKAFEFVVLPRIACIHSGNAHPVIRAACVTT